MYCTVDHIANDMTRATLISVSNDFEGAESINDELVLGCINDQSLYIDSYLSGRYPLPIVNIGDLTVLKNICVSLVACNLYQRRNQLDYSDNLVNRKKTAIADLEKIQKGIIKLNSGTEEAIPSKRTFTKIKKIFTDELLSQL